ncbi:MAG: DUF4126 domain-containing protein [Verrucomicrobiales bacterium]|jgi:hypothetical protein|nr:DUF4126 domain-containing protein [Verrucomicrobiales bacterium]
MTALTLISAALGLSALSGLSLYLTVFAVSLALNTGWLQPAGGFEHLCLLAHPAILIVSGVLALVEFVADKWPWFDSLWDAVHTVIRPVGAAFLGVATLGLGEFSPTVLIVSGLVCGAFSLTTHSAKAALRLLVNTSPEPVSNSVVSLAENGLVIGGVWLAGAHPVVMLAVSGGFLALFCWLAPKIFRHLYHTARFIVLKLKTVVDEPARHIITLPLIIGGGERARLEQHLADDEQLEWSVPVVTGKLPKLPRNRRAYLARLKPTGRLAICVKGRAPLLVDAGRLTVSAEARMLYDQLGFHNVDGERNYQLRFAKNHRAYLDTIKALFTRG